MSGWKTFEHWDHPLGIAGRLIAGGFLALFMAELTANGIDNWNQATTDRGEVDKFLENDNNKTAYTKADYEQKLTELREPYNNNNFHAFLNFTGAAAIFVSLFAIRPGRTTEGYVRDNGKISY